jgi:hypothetical protein
MTRLAGDVNPEDFVAAWARTLTNTPIVNEDPVMEGSNIIKGKEAAQQEFFGSWGGSESRPGLGS